MAPPAPRRAIPDWVAIVAIAGVALAASLAGIGNDFAQDDRVLIAQDIRIHDLANWREILTSPFWPPPYSQDLYRPLTSLLLGVEYALGGGAPIGFRIISYLLYAAAAIGLFVLAVKLLPRSLALAVALLFAAHPVHVEAVALGVGQNELIVGLLALLMTAYYLDRRRRGALGLRDWLVLGALYLVGSLFKEQGLVLPGLLLAAEAFLLAGPAIPKVHRLGSGYAFLAGLGVLVILMRRAALGGGIAGTFTAEALRGLTIGGRALTMLQVVPQWARLLLWPARLRADYSPQEMVASSHFGLAETVGLVLILGAAAGAWLGRKRAPVFSFGLAWMAVTLLPVSNILIPTGILLAERTLFLPSVGFLLAAGGLAGVVWRPKEGASARRWRGLAGAALVIAGVARSAERQGTWRNETVFSLRSARDSPRSWRTQKASGYALFEAGQRNEAVEAYQRAIALAPAADVWRVRNDLARRFWEAGENERAIDQLRASLSDSPEEEETRNYLVLGYLSLGQYAEAARQADSALARGASPETFGGLRALADSAARAGAPPGSIRIRIVPGPGQPDR